MDLVKAGKRSGRRAAARRWRVISLGSDSSSPSLPTTSLRSEVTSSYSSCDTACGCWRMATPQLSTARPSCRIDSQDCSKIANSTSGQSSTARAPALFASEPFLKFTPWTCRPSCDERPIRKPQSSNSCSTIRPYSVQLSYCRSAR